MKVSGRVQQFLEWTLALLLASVLFFAVYSWLGKPYRVKENHTTHHLKKGDLIWLDSDAYRPLKEISAFGEIEKAGLKDLVYFEFSDGHNSQMNLSGLARIAGFPGDTIKVYNGTTYVNGRAVDFGNSEIRRYAMVLTELVDKTGFRKSFKLPEIFEWKLDSVKGETKIEISTTEKNAIYIAGVLPVKSMNHILEKGVNPKVFPNGLENQNADNYGPVIVPMAGDSIHRQVYWEELKALSPAIKKTRPDSLIQVFTEEYYFLLSDYRSKGNDSRFFGAIPQSKIKSVLE